MSFVTVINIFFDTQCLQCQHTADTQQDLLFQTVFPVTSVQLVSDRTVKLAVHFIVCIEQIQRNASYVHSPYICMYVIIHIRHIYYQRFAVCIRHAVNRELSEVLCLVIGNLLSVHRQGLCKVTIAIQETYCTQIYITVRSFFQIVAGQYTQTTGIYFKNMIQTIFHAKVSH